MFKIYRKRKSAEEMQVLYPTTICPWEPALPEIKYVHLVRCDNSEKIEAAYLDEDKAEAHCEKLNIGITENQSEYWVDSMPLLDNVPRKPYCFSQKSP